MKRQTEPTAKEIEIARCITRFTTDNGFPPTVREIGEAVGLASTNTVHFYLEKMVRKGMIVKRSGSPRSIVVVKGAIE